MKKILVSIVLLGLAHLSLIHGVVGASYVLSAVAWVYILSVVAWVYIALLAMEATARAVDFDRASAAYYSKKLPPPAFAHALGILNMVTIGATLTWQGFIFTALMLFVAFAVVNIIHHIIKEQAK